MTSTLLKPTSNPSLKTPTIHRLANGLTIVAEHLPVDAVNLSLWLPVGSALETNEINGMAHFLEHMIFKGTQRLSSGEFERLIEERGALTNAATSQDYTHYYITTAPQDFAELAPLLFEVVLNAAIPDEAFERERFVVLEEIRRSEDNPNRRTYQRAIETAFASLPYHRPVLGPTSVIESLTSQQMRDFHHTYYQPQRMTAVVVGNLPVDELIKIVTKAVMDTIHHDATPRPDWTRDRGHHCLEMGYPTAVITGETPFTEIIRHQVVDPHLQQARLVMTWRVSGLTQLEETYGLDVLASILGQGRTSRLIQDLREQKQLVSSIVASNMTYAWGGVFYISARLALENVETVERMIAQHIQQLHIEPVTPAEMARVSTQVANRFIFGSETPAERANLYGYYQSLVQDLVPALTYPQKIQALTAGDLQKAARQYLDPNAYGTVILRPQTGQISP